MSTYYLTHTQHRKESFGVFSMLLVFMVHVYVGFLRLVQQAAWVGIREALELDIGLSP